MSTGPEIGVDELVARAEADRSSAAKRRNRLALVAPATITGVWLVVVLVGGHLGRVADNGVAALTMVFGSFVAGSTPQGGGAVAFPVFTKVVETPAEVARSFSLLIQTVGMGSAALAIVASGRRVSWRAYRLAAPVAVVAFVATLVLTGDGDAPFWPSRLPGPYVKVAFTLVVAAMAWLVLLAQRVPVRRIESELPPITRRLAAALVTAAALGGVASGLVGSGADVFVFLMVVLLLGLDSRVGVPTSVLVMATVSAVGFVVLGLVDGQLSIGIDGDRVVAVGGRPVGGAGLPADRFDLFGMWLASVPIVAWGAPAGSWVADRISRRTLVRFVMGLAAIEVVSTVVFLDELRTDPGLVVFGVVGLVAVVGGLTLVASHRSRLFGLPGVVGDATLRRNDLDVDPDYHNRLGSPEGRRR